MWFQKFERVDENPDVQMEISGYLPSKRGAKPEHNFGSIDDALTREWISLWRHGAKHMLTWIYKTHNVTLMWSIKRFDVFKPCWHGFLLPVIYYYVQTRAISVSVKNES